MQKRIILFLLAVCIVLAGYVAGTRLKMDKTGPKITFEDEILYQEDMDVNELLEDVKAYDEIDGDVSDSLMIESIYPLDDTKVVVVYVAKDSKNNITKVKRELSCKQEEEGSSDAQNESEVKKSTEDDKEMTPTPTVSSEPTKAAES